jgi:hypothetical protein
MFDDLYNLVEQVLLCAECGTLYEIIKYCERPEEPATVGSFCLFLVCFYCFFKGM